MSDRLSRQEIKRDEFVEALERSATFLERNARVLILSAVGVLLVVAAGLGIYWWSQARQAKAAVALAEAMEAYRAPAGPEVAAAEAEGWDGPTFASDAERRRSAKELFTVVNDEYGGSDAAAVSGVFLAQIASEEGDLERARQLWEGFLDTHSDHVLAGQVRVNLIHLDREEGRGEEVVGELEGELAATPEERTLPGDVVLWELAMTYEELGREEDARATYQRLAEEYPTSSYAAQARQKVPGAAGGAPGGLNPLTLPG